MGPSQLQAGEPVSGRSPLGVVAALRAAIAAHEAFDAFDRKAVQVADADGYFALAGKSIDAKKNLARALAAREDDGFVLQASTRDGRMLILAGSAKRAGCWQVSRFDRAGEPWGDTAFESKLYAVREFLDDAVLQSLADMDGLLLTADSACLAEA